MKKSIFSIAFIYCVLLVGAKTYAACNKPTLPDVTVDQYYTGTAGLQGDALKAKLNEIINDHIYYNYTPCVWEMLKEADEDPANSNNIVTIYTNRSIPKSRKDDGSGDQDSWNREHIWAKSKGFASRSQHAHTDAHHIRAADRSVNSDRSNNDFS